MTTLSLAERIEALYSKLQFWLWKFVHNAIIHPLLSFPWEGPRWLLRAHDWTAGKCKGAG